MERGSFRSSLVTFRAFSYVFSQRSMMVGGRGGGAAGDGEGEGEGDSGVGEEFAAGALVDAG